MAATIAAVCAVAVTGAAAIAVNLGILASSDAGRVGELSAGASGAQTVDVYLPAATPVAATPSSSARAAASREFVVGDAGSVVVSNASGTPHISSVSASPGWRWTAGAASGSISQGAFTDGRQTLLFTSSVGPSGDISGTVDTAPISSRSADDDDEHERGEHEERDHEGADDDD